MIFLITLTALSWFLQDHDKLIVDWISSHCHPIDTSDRGSAARELTFLSSFDENIQVLSIGEEAHGIGDFADIKFRIFKRLVEQYNFKLFLIEDDFHRVLKLNEYLLTGVGDPKQLLTYLVRSYANYESLNMIEWMRLYNINVNDRDKMLKIYGFDFNNSELIVNRLKTIFKEDGKILSLLDTIKFETNGKYYYYPSVSKNTLIAIRTAISETQKDESLGGLSAGQLLKMLEYCQQDGEEWRINRDEQMAEVIKWIFKMEGDRSKTLVSAHNLHVSYSPITNSDGDTVNVNMGMHLRNVLRNRLFTIGIDFYKGSFWAADYSRGSKETKRFTLPDAPQESISYLFSKTRKQCFYLDFKEIEKNPPIYAWFSKMRPKRNVTGVFAAGIPNESSMASTILTERYDGLIFFNEVKGANLLITPK